MSIEKTTPLHLNEYLDIDQTLSLLAQCGAPRNRAAVSYQLRRRQIPGAIRFGTRQTWLIPVTAIAKVFEVKLPDDLLSQIEEEKPQFLRIDKYLDIYQALEKLAQVGITMAPATMMNKLRDKLIPNGLQRWTIQTWIVPEDSLFDADGLPKIKQPQVGFPSGQKQANRKSAFASA